MKIKSIATNLLTLALIPASMSAIATLPACPELSLVKQSSQKLDKAIGPTDQSIYFVVTSAPAFDTSKKLWFVGTAPIYAKSEYEAIVNGQHNVRNALAKVTDVPYVFAETLYVCFYAGSSTEIPIVTIASIDDNKQPTAADFLKVKL